MTISPGTTSVSLDVLITDASGAGVSGLVAATFPIVFYALERAASVAVAPLSDLPGIGSPFSARGVIGRGTGRYRLDVPDAAWATSGRVTIYGEGASLTLIVPPIEVKQDSEFVGTGDIPVDHNTGGADNLRATTSGGIGIDGADVYAYLAVDWAANPATAAVQGHTRSGSDGRWATPMMLDSGTYTFVFSVTGHAIATAEQEVA